MSIRAQSIILALLVFGAIGITYAYERTSSVPEQKADIATVVSTETGASVSNAAEQDRRALPKRKWEVLDPSVDASAVMIVSLDSQFPFFNYQTYKQWPIASISKLITAIVVAEDMGYSKRIPITATAIATEGLAGDFTSGEVYKADDLVKIMLLTSSNDAATAFEEAAGGREQFVALLKKKLEAIGMTQTVMADACGLSGQNQSTANDLIKLSKYLMAHHPEIIEWTRLQSYEVQPINDSKSRTVYNIDAFVTETRFMGGKTGTSPEARENLLAFFSFGGERLAFIILGSHDRKGETEKLLNWVRTAYIFNR